jgi:hypothetical protein
MTNRARFNRAQATAAESRDSAAGHDFISRRS